ncbi:biotin-dependent carboxyltransferase family protein [Bosea vestrisii]|uniref:5-oxoprolinase subunit C family protein n=1 Tax=Bosea vestrisii TaxID=151416 RepID=UPI003267E69C
MSDAILSVVSVGPHVSIQDGGRSGFMRFGVPRSGAMDRASLAAANIALGNAANAPTIEVSMGGVVLECQAGILSLAIAGGGFVVQCGSAKVGSWSIVTLRTGERLTIRPGHWGSWTYLAFAGELVSEHWLGSASTHASSGLGGGRLKVGQLLHVRSASRREERGGDIPCPVTARPRSELHIVLGPQERFFSADALQTLMTRSYILSDAYDRMGVRLKGPALSPEGLLDMPSEAIVRGSIQVAGDGVPTILLADHQTTGGYPKIATVVDSELDSFVQLRSRDEIRFIPISPDKAVELSRSRHAGLARYYSAISTARGSLSQRLMGENLISGVVDAKGRNREDIRPQSQGAPRLRLSYERSFHGFLGPSIRAGASAGTL